MTDFEAVVPFSEEYVAIFQKISKNDDLLYYIMNVCCYALYIHHRMGQDSVNIMIPALKTVQSEQEMLILKLDVNEKLTVKEFLLYVRSQVADCYNNSIAVPAISNDYNYVITYDHLHSEVKLSKNENYMKLSLMSSEQETKGQLSACGNAYSEFVYKEFAQQFSLYSCRIFHDINEKIENLDVVSKEDAARYKQSLQGKVSDGYMDFDLCEKLKSIAEEFPDRVALTIDSKNYTYGELWTKVSLVASNLSNMTDEKVIGVWGNYDFNMIVSIFSILAANKTYFPIDCNLPYERLVKALKAVKCNVVLEYDKEDIEGVKSIMLDELVSMEPFTYRQCDHENQIAYVMFTSGTTGEPKLIPVKYQSLANYICWKKDEYGYDEKTVSLQTLSVNFDAFGSNLYPVLLFGGRMVMPAKAEKSNYSSVVNLIEREKVTEFNVVPSYYLNLLKSSTSNELASVQRVVLGGESTAKEIIRMSNEKCKWIALINEYGPTETTITATYNRDMNLDCVSVIGKMLPNEKACVLNELGKEVYPGIQGELCISGAGVMDGYLNEENSEVFVWIDGDMFYRTGDIVRYGETGEIEYLRRKNNQISLNGYRIDIEEIESGIVKSSLVSDCAVAVREDKYGNKYLCAFLVQKDAEKLTIDSISDYMNEHFADYMIPRQYVLVDEIMNSYNGKRDRELLAAIPIESLNILSKQNVTPKTETEKKMYSLWCNLLERENISCIDNFFKIGGNSLLVMEMEQCVKDMFGISVPITDFFDFYTIQSISEHIDTMRKQEGA